MVDAEAYKLMHGRDDDPTSKSGLSSEELKKDEPPGGAFTLMLPATMKGYGFHNKKWSTFIECLSHTSADHQHRYTTCGTH